MGIREGCCVAGRAVRQVMATISDAHAAALFRNSIMS